MTSEPGAAFMASNLNSRLARIGIFTLGRVVGNRPAKYRWTIEDSALAALAIPAVSAMHPGRCHPGFRAGELERGIFDAIAVAIQTELDKWKQSGDDVVDAYSFKAISITCDEVLSVAAVLRAIGSAHCVLDVHVFKTGTIPLGVRT